MLTATQAELSNERQQLQSEASLWRCEVAYLHQEYRKAVADLHRLETALRQQEQALEAYATLLAAHEQRLVGEEAEAPAEYEPGGMVERLTPHVSVGSHEILKHWRQREVHEQVKRQCYAVLAYWSLLLQTVAGPREGPDVLAAAKVRARSHG